MTEKQNSGKRAFIRKAVIATIGLFCLLLVFAAGIEVGHRLGYDEGWRDCKYDAKEQLFNIKDDTFWKWYGSPGSVIRRRSSFWLEL